MVAALEADQAAAEQHARYAARRAKLREALMSSGFQIDHSEGSLYLWVRRHTDGGDEDCWETVAWLAERGILAAPGTFYAPVGSSAGARHVRIAFTTSDERIDATVGSGRFHRLGRQRRPAPPGPRRWHQRRPVGSACAIPRRLPLRLVRQPRPRSHARCDNADLRPVAPEHGRSHCPLRPAAGAAGQAVRCWPGDRGRVLGLDARAGGAVGR